jgi:hypothetical protein
MATFIFLEGVGIERNQSCIITPHSDILVYHILTSSFRAVREIANNIPQENMLLSYGPDYDQIRAFTVPIILQIFNTTIIHIAGNSIVSKCAEAIAYAFGELK